MNGNQWLLCAAILSAVAAILHLLIIIGGADWYRFFGAGEQMALLAESGSIRPTLITMGIFIVLSVFSLYALSGAGLVAKLPLLKFALTTITSVFFLRGLAGLILAWLTSVPKYAAHPVVAQNSGLFWYVSSFICLLYAFCYLFGTIGNWAKL